MSRTFLALVSLAAIGVLAILLVRASGQKDSGVDAAIARVEKIIGLANKQTDHTVAAARQLADRYPAPPLVPSVPSSIRVTVDQPIQVVVQPSPSSPSREDQFKDWLREKHIW